MVDAIPEWGPEFAFPTAKERRAARARHEDLHGVRMFRTAQLRSLIENAIGPLKPLLLLAINAGMTQQEVSDLRIQGINWELGLIRTARVETQIVRDFVAWPETLQALWDWLAHRYHPRDKAHVQRAFLTRTGQEFVRDIVGRSGRPAHWDSVITEFNKLVGYLEMELPKGLNFG